MARIPALALLALAVLTLATSQQAAAFNCALQTGAEGYENVECETYCIA